MDDTDLPVTISMRSISDYFICSICMCSMKETHMTKCGHRYCVKCIQEWVDRRHKCPCCNTQLDKDQLIKDHQYDSLIGAILKEKEKSEETYFESLIYSSSGENCIKMEDIKLSPIEAVFKNHLKDNLGAHEKCLQTLKKQLHTRLKKLEQEAQSAREELKTQGLFQTDLDQEKGKIDNNLTNHKAELEKEFESCSQLIAQAYDKHLTEHIPKLSVLPVKITINVLPKDLKISDVVFAPTDRTKPRVIGAVEGAMSANKDKLVKWPEDVQFILFGPFAKCNQHETEKIVQEVLQNGVTYPDVTVLDSQSMPVLHQSMSPGSEIVIFGEVKFESDLPKKCFAGLYKKEEDQIVDYFICQSCNFKWICRSCMEVCHKGHVIQPYIMNFHPSWACCYCPKNKKCIIRE
ncbi:uncharacterized protein LOC143073008 [Mytilus galloprovincialis]|uniref:uncharacterized protein LOC143073008 n=1 Tax=Mytilus galloprovincialis TaxID=29158 RepID=UPI003F7B9F65